MGAAGIDAAVLAEVGRVRVVQKVLPGVVLADGALTGNVVQADLFDPKTMSIAEGKTLGLIEIQVEFQLTDGPVGSESTCHVGRTLSLFQTADRARRGVPARRPGDG